MSASKTASKCAQESASQSITIIIRDRMSKPPLNPTKTVSGIAVGKRYMCDHARVTNGRYPADPRSLERVVPQSKRPDGTYVFDFHYTVVFSHCLHIYCMQPPKRTKDPTGLHTTRRCNPISGN